MNKYMDARQDDFFGNELDRALLDSLIDESKLYKISDDYLELLDFIVRMKNFAPFNAMLLQIQKKGLRFAASQRDWKERFGRTIKEHARPLLIQWTFGPIGFVYDIADTEGDELPVDVAATFRAFGDMSHEDIHHYINLLAKRNIYCELVSEFGDGYAGQIRRDGEVPTKSSTLSYKYKIALNASHPPSVQFATLVHELGHLYAGHLGSDDLMKIKNRSTLSHAQEECEAESASYLVCERRNVKSEAYKYLSNFSGGKKMPDFDVYQVMKVTGKIESILDLAATTKFYKGA